MKEMMKLDGGSGDDQIDGGSGDDQIDGGSGDDQIDGGVGADELKGGKGEDLFICDEQDTVIDFNSLENDENKVIVNLLIEH
jgi:Ca2+-binding RTX toxin-like protein